MNISFNKIPGSGRVSPLNSEIDPQGANSNKSGIRTHNSVTAFFLKRFGKVVDVSTNEGKVIHLNRNSLDKWLKSHHSNIPADKTNEAYLEAIQGVAVASVQTQPPPAKEKPQLTVEQQKLLDTTTQAVENFKSDKDFQNYEPKRDENGNNETVRIGDYAQGLKDNGELGSYQLEQLGSYVGLSHTLVRGTDQKGVNPKIFGGGGWKIHIGINPLVTDNRLKALKALLPILMDPENGVVQCKLFAATSKDELTKWFGHSDFRPGGQQGKEITLYLVDEAQIEKARTAGMSEEDLAVARKFVKTPEQIAALVRACLQALKDAGIEENDIGYLQNVSDTYLTRGVGMRDDRDANGNTDQRAYIGQHAHGNYVEGVAQWGDPSDSVRELLENASKE